MTIFSNCVLWAAPKWFRGCLRGEALVIRRSRYHVMPHVMLASCLRGLGVREYVPTRRMRWPIPRLLFRGAVRWGEALCMCTDCRAAR